MLSKEEFKKYIGDDIPDAQVDAFRDVLYVFVESMYDVHFDGKDLLIKPKHD